MSYNGSGTFVINTAGQPVVSGTVISSTAFNALTADLATGLSTAITKDGQTTPTANIPMGNNKITGLAVGTAATDAANLSQAQSTASKLITVSGTDTVTGTLSPTLAAYAAGQMFYWVAAGTNTGAVTLNIDSLGAKAVTRDGSTALAAGDIRSGEVVVVVYDGTRFQVVSQINSAGDATFANVSITSALNVGGVATFTNNPVLSGGTANGVVYLNGSKAATSGSAVTYDGTTFSTTGAANFATSTGKVGIGTTTPTQTLEVKSNNAFGQFTIDSAGGQYSQMFFKNNGTAVGSLFTDNTNNFLDVYGYGSVGIRFSTNNAESMRITSAGNVGIGTSSPSTKLYVYSSGTNVATLDSPAANENRLDFAKVGTRKWSLYSPSSSNDLRIYDNQTIGDVVTFQSGGNVGIGTTSPSYKLDVRGVTASGNGTITTGFSYDTGGLVGTLSNHALGILTNGTVVAKFDTSGNLGLGVTPSAWAAGFSAFQFSSGGVVWSNGNNANVGSNHYYNGSSYVYKSSDYASRYQQLNGQHQFYTAPSGTAGNAITFTQAMTLDASGRLGIGTTSPSQPLHVDASGGGVVRVTRLGTSATAYGQLENDGTNSSISSTGALILNTGSSPAERARIDSSGNFGIGTTTMTSKLNVNGDIRTAGGGDLRLSNNGDPSITADDTFLYNDAKNLIVWTNGAERARITSGGKFLIAKTTDSFTSSDGYVFGEDGQSGVTSGYTTNAATTWKVYSTGAAAYRFYVGYDGVVNATNATISAISDQRLKENVRDLDAGLNAVMALKPRKFDWKEGKGKDIKDDRGFIAQEFEQVFPDLVDEWKDPAPDGEEPYKSVRQDLIPVLVKAIQEQQAIIEQLKADVAALKGA